MAAYTFIHVVISLVAIVAGFVVFYGFLVNRDWNRWTELFLSTTVLTSVTGFGFPATRITPGHVVGAISLVVLAIAIYARYGGYTTGTRRPAYVIGSVVALYLNFFVLIVQMFQKIPVLKALAPTQSELPFTVAQVVTLLGFFVLGVAATRSFRLMNAVRSVVA